jgi:phenylacetate-coenzyme A ligase PaaK-like adenylate-forming protein
MPTLSVPDTKHLKHVQELCEITSPYESSNTLDTLFVSAFKEIMHWHQRHNSFYANLLKKEGFDIESIKSVEDIAQVPLIHANFFKLHESISIKKSEISEHMTSSGTSGQKSQMFFDEWSILSARRMVRFIYDKNDFNRPDEETNFLLLAYEPLSNFKVGTTRTNIFLTSFAKAKEVFFALRATGDTHEFDRFGTVRKLQEYEAQKLPVRIHGFPSFMYFTLMQMQEMDIKLSLHKDSLVMFGGGWKGYADQEISKDRLFALIHERLGISTQRIRDTYGSVEHSIPYIECKYHHLHVPIWSRLFIRDVKTLEVLGYEKAGFMNFVTPYITSVPAVSVMMGDLGVLHPASECKCGALTPFFEILGRAGLSQNKSCAVSASELLKPKGV